MLIGWEQENNLRAALNLKNCIYHKIYYNIINFGLLVVGKTRVNTIFFLHIIFSFLFEVERILGLEGKIKFIKSSF